MTATDTSWRGKSVLVTGASGFIGGHLVSRLRGLGAEVHAVARSIPASTEQVRWHQVHLEDAAAVRQLLQATRPRVVFHLASHVSGKRDLGVVLPTLQSNLVSTVNLLVASAELGCERMVLTGSLEEPEGDAANAIPASPYAAAKWASSAYARMFHALYQAPVATARLFMVYGPAQRDVTKLIPYVTLALLRKQAPQLMSGTRPVDWIYVDDVVDGYLALATAQDAVGKTVDLGTGQLTTVREVVESISDIIQAGVAPSFGSVADRPMERVRKADVAATHRLIHWQPKTSLLEGLRRTVDWYRQHGAGK